jgi:hypothetical protein
LNARVPILGFLRISIVVLLDPILVFYFFLILLFLIFVMLQPAKRHAYAQTGDNVFTPVERELVFDIVS